MTIDANKPLRDLRVYKIMPAAAATALVREQAIAVRPSLDGTKVLLKFATPARVPAAANAHASMTQAEALVAMQDPDWKLVGP